MAKVTNELMYELLKTLHERLAKLYGKIDEVKAELAAIRGYIYAEHQDISNIYAMLGKHDVRLDRIERRLELTSAAVT